MLKNKAKGDYGEDLATQYLMAKGYVILEKQFRRRVGEVDIIARHDGIIVFVEVKYRQNISYGLPREAVTKSKQERMKKAASYYLLEQGIYDQDLRLDVIEIIDNGTLLIEHLENAFC